MATSIERVALPRPKTIEDVAGQIEVVTILKRTLVSENLPHLLFYGPPGTGKTSTILALARDMFGPQLYRCRILELNASDERGIDVIREKVKNFAKMTVREVAPGYPCPPFKLIVLDEADSLTTDAQTALRRVMEIYSKGTRFCIICNYVSRIIEPLTSRCAKFRFKPVDVSSGISKLEFICGEEAVQLQEGRDTLKKLLEIADGDMRRAITLLQSCHRLGTTVSSSKLIEFGGIIPTELVAEAYQICQNNDLKALIEFARKRVIRQAYSAHQFLRQFIQMIFLDPTISSLKKSMISLRASQTDHLLHDGADELLQLLNLLNYCQTILYSSTKSPNLTVSAF